jgi:hypothetical protein
MKRILVLFALLTACIHAADPAKAAFKAELLPKIGEKITVTGSLGVAKLGWALQFDGWFAYIYPKEHTKKSRVAQAAFEKFKGQTITLTGILHYDKGSSHAGTTAGLPEHFYFDPTECTVTE